MRRQRHRIRPAMQARKQRDRDNADIAALRTLPDILQRIIEGLRRVHEDQEARAEFQRAMIKWAIGQPEITMKEFNPNVIDPPR